MTQATTIAELRKMNPTDLRRELEEQRRACAKLRLNLALGKEKGSHLSRAARRQLARMLTVLRDVERQSA